MYAHLLSQQLFQNSQIENLIFSQMTFREISRLDRTTPFGIQTYSVDPDRSALGGAVWPRGYKTFFMLNSTEHEISNEYRQRKKFLAFSLPCDVFTMLINVKMPTIVGILTFMSRINFVLS